MAQLKLKPAWLTLDGKRWLFDEASWPLANWFVIKNVTGLGRVSFINGVLDEDPTALQALIWFLRREEEPGLRLDSVQFRPSDLEWDSVEEVDAVPPSVGGDAEDPPKTSESDGTTTSPPLPASTATPAGMSTP